MERTIVNPYTKGITTATTKTNTNKNVKGPSAAIYIAPSDRLVEHHGSGERGRKGKSPTSVISQLRGGESRSSPVLIPSRDDGASSSTVPRTPKPESDALSNKKSISLKAQLRKQIEDLKRRQRLQKEEAARNQLRKQEELVDQQRRKILDEKEKKSRQPEQQMLSQVSTDQSRRPAKTGIETNGSRASVNANASFHEFSTNEAKKLSVESNSQANAIESLANDTHPRRTREGDDGAVQTIGSSQVVPQQEHSVHSKQTPISKSGKMIVESSYENDKVLPIVVTEKSMEEKPMANVSTIPKSITTCPGPRQSSLVNGTLNSESTMELSSSTALEPHVTVVPSNTSGTIEKSAAHELYARPALDKANQQELTFQKPNSSVSEQVNNIALKHPQVSNADITNYNSGWMGPPNPMMGPFVNPLSSPLWPYTVFNGMMPPTLPTNYGIPVVPKACFPYGFPYMQHIPYFMPNAYSPFVSGGTSTNLILPPCGAPFPSTGSRTEHATLTAPPFSAPMNQPTQSRRSRPRPPKPMHVPQEEVLTPQPLSAPSPFALTHEHWPHTIVLLKKNDDQGYGVKIQRITQTALVALHEWPRASEKERIDKILAQGEVKQETQASDTGPAPQQDQKGETAIDANLSSIDESTKRVASSSRPHRSRRKRMQFPVMQVLDPSSQNERNNAPQDKLLQPGDIILGIRGENTGGLGFAQACKLFSSKESESSDGWIRCEVLVARKRPPKPPKPAPQPKPVIETKSYKSRSNGNVDDSEIQALCKAILAVLSDPSRDLGFGFDPFNDTMVDRLACSLQQAPRTVDTWRKAWSSLTHKLYLQIMEKALEHWKAEWSREVEGIRSLTNCVPLSDAQRSEMRCRPRPPVGCRCGSQTHEFVYDINCPLYSNLRRLVDDDAEASAPHVELNLKLSLELNAIETAFKDRFIRAKKEEAAMKAEAEFIARMERIQLHKLRKAIHSPGLSAIVLSAVKELEQDWRELTVPLCDPHKILEMINKPSHKAESKDLVEDDDEDDDIPLVALGKRASTEPNQTSKKQRVENAVPLSYIGALLYYISVRWGHVYKEPCDEDHAWRWELFRGSQVIKTSEHSADSCSRNPRRQGALSLENIQFALQPELISQLRCLEVGDSFDISQATETMKVLAYVMSSTTCGVCDELLALLQTSVLRLNSAGVPLLADNWYHFVDFQLLEECYMDWGVKADPDGKFGISDGIRSTIAREWQRTSRGWALAEDPRDVIYSFEEFDEWRDAFENRENEMVNAVEGVGQFGF